MRLLWSGMCFFIGAILIVGCGKKLNDVRDVKLTSLDVKTLTVDPVDSDQEIRVRVTSKGKLHVHCFLAKDQEDVEKAISGKTKSDKILAQEIDSETADLKFTVPANEGLTVRLSTNKNAEANVKITN